MKKAIIHDEVLRLPRFEDMTAEELMIRAEKYRFHGRFCRDTAKAIQYFRCSCWLLELAARKIG